MARAGDEASGETALEASFARDARRAVAFDKLFRRVRGRKENDKLLALVARRLEVTDDPQEIQKLFWEQARVLREKGDQDGALDALEHVTMLEPDHVGALALLGEINIRRGNFEEAAGVAGAAGDASTSAPAKNRVTAGIAAVDLYENKLERFDKALESCCWPCTPPSCRRCRFANAWRAPRRAPARGRTRRPSSKS